MQKVITLPVALIIFSLHAGVIQAQEKPVAPLPRAELPNPLSLEQALALADKTDPDLVLAEAGLDDARAQLWSAESSTGLRSYIDILAETKRLTTTGDFSNDSIARFVISKSLYDFGRSRAQEDAKASIVSSQKYALYDAHLRHQYKIIQLFYDVLVADSRYVVDNEEMTQFFLAYDKDRERHASGIISDLELLETEIPYLQTLDQRTESELQQRKARLLLAIALNRPDSLPGELVEPTRTPINNHIPDEKLVYETAAKHNRTLVSLQEKVESSRAGLRAARVRYYPTLSADVELADYKRSFATRGDVRASLRFIAPLYQGNENKAAIARARAELASSTAQLKKAQQTLLANTRDLIRQLKILYAKRKTASRRVEYRDLFLDRQRALYEMEVQTNMGEAQALSTRALWLFKKNGYEIILAWAQLNVLLGQPPGTRHEVTLQ